MRGAPKVMPPIYSHRNFYSYEHNNNATQSLWRRDNYCYKKWNWQSEFKSSLRLFAFHFALMPIGKGMNPPVLPPAMGKY